MPRSIPPPHPDETMREDILHPLGVSANHLAKALSVTAARQNGIVRGLRGIACGYRAAFGPVSQAA
jgi:plasmid maintenance system antidote protein VapI